MPLSASIKSTGCFDMKRAASRLRPLQKCECLLVGWQVVAASSTVDADFSEVDVPRLDVIEAAELGGFRWNASAPALPRGCCTRRGGHLVKRVRVPS